MWTVGFIHRRVRYGADVGRSDALTARAEAATDGANRPRLDNWFGQPRGLVILFLTEMWEQFSFYGMRTLLVYYMTRQLVIGQEKASLIYGTYTAIIYLTPIFGGVISDRWLGRRNSVVLGGSIMAIGHFMMTFEVLFYPALATVAIGNGLFLPSLPSQIGSLYSHDDPRRASAYNVYYVGLNLGAFLAPLICGTLGEVYGWHWGFAAAGIGMIAGLAIYLSGSRYLPRDPLRAAEVTASAAPTQDLARRFTLLLGVGAVVVVFRAAYAQLGNTVALWVDTGVDRTLAGTWTIPMTWFQSLNPLMVFLLTPLLIARWTRMARDGREPSSLSKMATGAAVVALSYVLIATVSAWHAELNVRTSWTWAAAFFIFVTVGELYILPVGLGLFGRLAPRLHTATTIAAWFLAAFAGNLLAGGVGTLWSRHSPAEFFLTLAGLAGTSALLLALLNRPVQQFERTEQQHAIGQTSPTRSLPPA